MCEIKNKVDLVIKLQKRIKKLVLSKTPKKWIFVEKLN